MSNGVAYPILRTPDLDLALRVARQMVVFGAQPGSEVSVLVEVPTVTEAGRLRDALPDTWFESESMDAPIVPQLCIPDLTCAVPARELPDDLTDAQA